MEDGNEELGHEDLARVKAVSCGDLESDSIGS
jgi:hypothetical protein